MARKKIPLKLNTSFKIMKGPGLTFPGFSYVHVPFAEKWNILVDIFRFTELYFYLMKSEGNGKEPMKY
jgi:hypothetical protein